MLARVWWAGVWLAGVWLTTFGWTSGAHAGQAPIAEFTAEERQALEAGELVQRPVEKRRGDLRLMGGTSYQLIAAPAHVVWQALLDTPHYHRMMPRVLEAKLVEAKSAQRTVYMRQGAEGIAEHAYYLKVDVDAQQGDIAFKMDEQRPHDLRAAWGFYQVRAYGEKTLLVYGVMADIGSGWLAGLARGSVHEWMLRTPWMVKRFVEGSGRHIYDWSSATPEQSVLRRALPNKS